MKICNLSGKHLDYWVAKAQGWINYPTDSIEAGTLWHTDIEKAPFGRTIRCADYTPSTHWDQTGELIEKFQTDFYYDESEPPRCRAEVLVRVGNKPGYVSAWGKNPQLAICRAVVKSVFGEEVPKEPLPIY